MTEIAQPILYSFRRCPYAMRARLALAVSGTRHELREVKLSAKPEEMIALSPKATVPVLALPGGEVIDESLDIMHWALEQNDPEGWLKRCDEGLIACNDGSFKHDLDRYKYPDRYGSDATAHRETALGFLRELEQRLSASPQLNGEHRGMTDMAIFPFIRQFVAVDRDWFETTPLPRLRVWLAGHLSSSLFASIMTKRKPWSPGDPAIIVAEGAP